jgi:hypothetical protein
VGSSGGKFDAMKRSAAAAALGVIALCAARLGATPTDVRAPGAPAGAAPTSSPATRPSRRRIVVVGTTRPTRPANAIPDITAQSQARDRIRSIYAADYNDVSYPARRALAKRLIDAAAQTVRDFDAKYTLLVEARDLAAGAGDVPTAFEAIDRLVEVFPVEKLPERVEALRRAAPELESQASNLAVASIALDLSEQCVIEGDYERADALLTLAGESAARGKSNTMCGWVASRAAAVRPFKAAYDLAHPYELVLARTPEDCEANGVVGKFVAFVKRDFDTGLIMLSKSSDPALARLADLDLDTPADRPSLQLKLADEWWNAAQASGEYREPMRRRAEFWYRKALPNLDGLDRAAAERRLAELAPPAPKIKRQTPRPPDAIRLSGHSYRVHWADVSWETARQLCEESGGHLVCIETRNENELMVKLARGRALWLGAVSDGEGRWSWVNNGNFFFNYWSLGEPSLHGADAHVLTTPNGAWKSSTGRAGFICEWDD